MNKLEPNQFNILDFVAIAYEYVRFANIFEKFEFCSDISRKQ